MSILGKIQRREGLRGNLFVGQNRWKPLHFTADNKKCFPLLRCPWLGLYQRYSSHEDQIQHLPGEQLQDFFLKSLYELIE